MIVSSYAELISWMYSCALSGCPFLQLGQNNTQMVAHIMPQDRQSLAADLYLFNFVLHGLKLHFTKIAVLRYLLFILIFLKVDDEKYQVGNAECKSHEFNTALFPE